MIKDEGNSTRSWYTTWAAVHSMYLSWNWADGVFEVLATNGNNKLGGDDFDEALLNFMADSFAKENGVDLEKRSIWPTRD